MTVPVPLTDIERAARAVPDADEVLALCKALRIAVEVLVWTTENYTPTHDERLRDRNDGCWCVSCESRRTLARVRELVDLGGDK